MASKSIKPNSRGRKITHKNKEVIKILKWDHNIYNASHNLMHHYCKHHTHVSRWRKWLSSGAKNNGSKIKSLRGVSFLHKALCIYPKHSGGNSNNKIFTALKSWFYRGFKKREKTVQVQDIIHRSESAREMGSYGGTDHLSCCPKIDAPAEAWWILSSSCYRCKYGEHRPGTSMHWGPQQG